MGLQTDDLSMVTLGVVDETPPHPLQPKLKNGMHLRYALSSAKGYPWHGSYVFRRKSDHGFSDCLESYLRQLSVGTAGQQASIADVNFASTPSILYTNDFAPQGSVEIDIAHPDGLTAVFTKGPVRQVHAKVGIRDIPGANDRRTGLLRFTSREPQTLPREYVESQVRFHTRPANAEQEPFTPAMAFESIQGRGAMRFGHEGYPCTLVIDLPVIAECVHLVLTNPTAGLTVRSFDINGNPTAGTPKALPSKSHHVLSLGPAKTTRVEIETAGELAGLIWLFYFSIRKQPPIPRTILLQAWDNQVLVDETTLTGKGGTVVEGDVHGDRITHVRWICIAERESDRPPMERGEGGLPVNAEGDRPPRNPDDGTEGRTEQDADAGDRYGRGVSCAALIDMCWAYVADHLGAGWEEIPGINGPIALPVAEPTYPCVTHPVSLSDARQTARDRVKYDALSKWPDARLDVLHQELHHLVVGGPGSTPMPDRKRSYDAINLSDPKQSKAIKDQNLLGLTYLASLDPAMAQVLGLYVIDETAVPGVAYDYIVLAEHHTTVTSDQFNGSSKTALQRLKTGLPSNVDAWICFERKLANAPPLIAPNQPNVMVLPTAPQNKKPGVARGGVGLQWNLQALQGYLTPGAPVRYTLYRAEHGTTAPNKLPAVADYKALNPDQPMLATKSAPPPSSATAPPDWPPGPLNAFDRGLADGWYSYALSGIDLFGRFSPLSLPARWRQWGPPAPAPTPWYYQAPPGERTVHAYAVEIRDMTPPAAPLAIEATALDPEDDLTFVRDSAYDGWWSGPTSGGQQGTKALWWDTLPKAQQKKVLPLRVQWQWSASQLADHPDVQEFRIYFNPGATAPPEPGRTAPANWQDRIWVVGIDDNYTDVSAKVGQEAYRQYAVLLPLLALPSGAPPFAGVPLEPSLPEPIVYANVSVSSANDKTYASDHNKWSASAWGNRHGVEGTLAAPAKIFRAWREKPPPPLPLINDERVWATKADFQSNSFYTFRWASVQYTKAHIFVLLDRTLLLSERRSDNIGVTALTNAEKNVLDALWPPTGSAAPPSAIAAAVSAEIDAFRAKKADPDYRTHFANLSDNALRGLAALPMHEDEYIQLTADAVDSPDVVGPDDPPDYTPNSAWSSYRARFDGRATNRYFLRAALTDTANNEGPMGLPTPPIYLPAVVAPKTPSVTKVMSGNLEVTLVFSTTGMAATGKIFVFRTEDKAQLVDVRLMDLVGTLEAASLDLNVATAGFNDNTGLIGGHTYYYKAVFEDADGRPSKPSRAFAATIVDERVPPPPIWTGQTWHIENETTGVLSDWPIDGIIPSGHRAVLALSWMTDTPDPHFVVTRRTEGSNVWQQPDDMSYVVANAQSPFAFTAIDRSVDPNATYFYRVKLRSGPGVWSKDYSRLTTATPFVA